MSLLAPSILASDLARLGEEVVACAEAGADRIHIDIMDNHFVPNLTMGPDVVAACRRSTELFLEAHLMVEVPDEIIPRFSGAGADLITVHLEACPRLRDTVDLIRAQGSSCGVGIKPATAAESLTDILPAIDLALVMTVEPGFGGQQFLAPMLAKVRRLRQIVEADQLSCDIEVDGGIDASTGRECLAAGASVLVAGTAIFKAPGGTRAGVGCLLEAMGRGPAPARQTA